MGKVVERVKVTNFKDTSKSIEIEAVIDTGATMSVLPMDLIQKLGLERIDEFMATSPNRGHTATLRSAKFPFGKLRMSARR